VALPRADPGGCRAARRRHPPGTLSPLSFPACRRVPGSATEAITELLGPGRRRPAAGAGGTK
jgi:hypothetical protein